MISAASGALVFPVPFWPPSGAYKSCSQCLSPELWFHNRRYFLENTSSKHIPADITSIPPPHGSPRGPHAATPHYRLRTRNSAAAPRAAAGVGGAAAPPPRRPGADAPGAGPSRAPRDRRARTAPGPVAAGGPPPSPCVWAVCVARRVSLGVCGACRAPADRAPMRAPRTAPRRRPRRRGSACRLLPGAVVQLRHHAPGAGETERTPPPPRPRAAGARRLGPGGVPGPRRGRALAASDPEKEHLSAATFLL